MGKIKIVCRRKGGTYEQQIFSGGEPSDALQQDTAMAQKFLNAFSPETITQKCTERYGEDFVLVMRTDDVQMQEFDALLKEHDKEHDADDGVSG